MKSEDCENDRHKYYWEKIKAPYVYAKGFLYNDEDHPNARAAAAIMRNIHREDAPLAMKASVEGGVISRGIKDPTRLMATKIHSIALTFTPANNATLCEPLSLDKSDSNWEADKQLIKSVMHLAETNIPSFRHIERHASANTIYENIQRIRELAKTIGINIEVKESDPDTIINQAVMCKIENNINKINDIVKAFKDVEGKWQPGSENPPLTSQKLAIPEGNEPKKAEFEARRDKTQKDLIDLRAGAQTSPDTTTPDITSDINRTVTGSKQASNIVIGRHARKAASNPAHLDNIYSQLKESHGHDKASAVIAKLKQKMQKSIKEHMIKALTAGYGGAGAPTNMSGGGVIQSESLDDGRQSNKSDLLDITGMKYITCDDCGKEQVHMEHQVKCRDCSKSFSLSKLANIL